MKRVRNMFIVCFALLGLAGLALAQDAKSTSQSKSKGGPVAGTWTCTSHGWPNGDIPFTLYIEEENETVTGSVSSSMGDAEFSSASFKDGTLEIHIEGDDETYVLTGKLQNGQLSGQWTNGSTDKGTWAGKKGSDAPTSK